MKTLFFILIFTLSTMSFASSLMESAQLKVISVHGNVELDKIKAKLTISCFYKKGIIFPTSKSCGRQTMPLAVEEGTIVIPKIKKFSTHHGGTTSNYDFVLTLSEQDHLIGGINLCGKDIIKTNLNHLNLYIYRFNKSELKLTKDGKDFFESELIKEEQAKLFISFDKKDLNNSPIIVSSSLNAPLWFRENYPFYEGKPLLKDEYKISLPELYYLSLTPPEAKEEGILHIVYYKNEYPRFELTKSIKVDLTPDLFQKIGVVEL